MNKTDQKQSHNHSQETEGHEAIQQPEETPREPQGLMSLEWQLYRHELA